MSPRKTTVGSPEDPWERLELDIPGSWKRELEKLAQARALSVAALVRQLIRELILRRHDVARVEP